MTNGEAKRLETEVLIFPVEYDQANHETIEIDEKVTPTVLENRSIKTDIKIRFARLKKSLRKRSANIL